jgi:hypothetical protein
MKKSILAFCIFCISTIAAPQTPSVSIKFNLQEIMYHGENSLSKYSVYIERCRFRENVIKFSHDTSTVDWKNLTEEIKSKMLCENVYKVFKEGYVIDCYFRNHDFAFEYTYKIKIYREKSGNKDSMLVFFPIKISSFVTMVEFGVLYYSPGVFDLTDDMEYSLDNGSHLIIKPKDNALPK